MASVRVSNAYKMKKKRNIDNIYLYVTVTPFSTKSNYPDQR